MALAAEADGDGEIGVEEFEAGGLVFDEDAEGGEVEDAVESGALGAVGVV